MEILAQRALQLGPRPRCAAQAQIDPSRKERRERAELLGNLKRRVVGQHDPARANADGACGMADMCEHHRGRSARDAIHCMVLGHPEALAACTFGDAGEAGGGGEGFFQRAALAHRHQIEDREGGHGLSCAR